MSNVFSYKDLLVYQIYPLSFFDANGDGIGDLEGIIEKVHYIKKLGVNAVWLSPIYESPMEDNGYDISDYKKINPMFGTMEDFERLVKVFHDNQLRVIMDLVVNHTSSEHFWFKKALAGDKKYQDYYLFSEKKNNWTSFFGGSAWDYNDKLKKYYLHLFAKGQPDLNWENPEVVSEIKDILKFYMDKGVDGFRCDVINLLSKVDGLPNGKKSLVLKGSEHYLNGPNIHKHLQELRSVIDKNNGFLIGEGVFVSPTDALSYEKNNEIEMFFQFDHMGCDNHFIKWFPKKFKFKNLHKTLIKWQHALANDGWNTLYFTNHDQPRAVSRFGSEKYRIASSKFLYTYLFLQKGTPFVYQGEEIGMTNPNFSSIDMYEDIESKNVYKILKKVLPKKIVMSIIKSRSRDNARTPMQWSSDLNGGFSKSKPWFLLNSNFEEINVENDLKSNTSIYKYFQKLLSIKQMSISRDGKFIDLSNNYNKLVHYKRVLDNEELVVVGNPTIRKRKIKTEYKEENLVLSNYNNKSDIFREYEIRVYLNK